MARIGFLRALSGVSPWSLTPVTVFVGESDFLFSMSKRSLRTTGELTQLENPSITEVLNCLEETSIFTANKIVCVKTNKFVPKQGAKKILDAVGGNTLIWWSTGGSKAALDEVSSRRYTVAKCDPPKSTESKTVRAMASFVGVMIDGQAADELARRSLDPHFLHMELLKYATVTGRVTMQEIRELSPATANVGTSAFVAAIFSRDGAKALKALRSREDVDPCQLSRQLMKLVQDLTLVKSMKKRGCMPKEISRESKVPYQTVLPLFSAEQRFSAADLCQLYMNLCGLDLQIRTGLDENAYVFRVVSLFEGG